MSRLVSLTNLSLGKKVAFLTVVGLILGGSMFAFLSIQALNRSTQAMLEERLMTTSLIAVYADEVLERALGELTNVAQGVEGDFLTPGTQSQLIALEATYSRMSIATPNIFLLSEDGNVVWSRSEYDRLQGIDMTPYLADVDISANSVPGISGLVTIPGTQIPVVLLLSSTAEGQDGTNGVLVTAVDLTRSSIGGFIQPLGLGETGYVEIVDQNGVVIARTDPGRELAPFEESDHPDRFAELILTGEPTVGTCHTCHIEQEQATGRDVLAFAPLSAAPWGVAIRQSEEEALAPTRQLRQRLLISGGGLLGIALLFVGISTRGVVRRIRTLTTACQRISGGDLTTPITPMGADEVGALASTFDHMRVRLKASHGQLEQRTRELSSLLTVSEILTSAPDLTHLLDAVLGKAVEVIPEADGGVLFLEDPHQRALVAQSVVGLEMSSLPRIPLTSDDTAQWMPQEPEVFAKQVCDMFVGPDGRYAKVESAIHAPVINKGRCIGCLIMVADKQSPAFSGADSRLIETIADYIAIAVERARLTQEAEEAKAWREADRLKSQFISSISHELRTPLTSIKGYSTSLLRQDTTWDEETKREFLETIDIKTDELRDLIDKLLQMARLEAGQPESEREPVLIPHLARKIVQEMAPHAKEHEITLEFPKSVPVVEADVRQMEQVLCNLLENAVKYSPMGGKIAVAGEAKGDHVLITVSDEGVSISKEHQNKVFERFFRVNSLQTRGTPGTGLGLAIAKAHVTAHGGNIWVDSAPGMGSKFCFTWPLKVSPDQSGSSANVAKGVR